MHAVGDHRCAVPVGRIDEPLRAVRVPRIVHRPRKQVLGGVDVGPRAVSVGEGAQRPLHDEARPFDAMARRGAIRFELVVLLVGVAFEVQRPVGFEMLGDAPPVVCRPFDDVVDDAAGADAIGVVPGGVGHGQERFGGVHVGVETTVRVELGEFGVPGVDGQTDFVIPEMLVIRGKRLIKQFLGTRTSGQQGRGCGEYHEGMRIADLARSMGAVREHLRIPAAVLVVMQNAGQSLERRIGQLARTRVSEHGANRIHMGHTAGDPRFDAV